MQLPVRVLYALLLALLIPANALAWGNQGHEAVGAIADQLIAGSTAETHVRSILAPNETLRRASTWADRVKAKRLTDPEMLRYVKKNKQHRQYHYTDVPIDAAGYQPDGIGTTDHDIVISLQQCIAALKGKKAGPENPHRFTQREALRLLAHFIGDLHQPLHVGSAYVNDDDEFFQPHDESQIDEATGFATNGGNYLLVGSNSLHSYWDNKAISNARRIAGVHSFQDFTVALAPQGASAMPGAGDVATWPAQWANESLRAAKAAFRDVTIDERIDPADPDGSSPIKWTIVLPDGYDDSAADAAKAQLALAGRRLAAMLQAIWP